MIEKGYIRRLLERISKRTPQLKQGALSLNTKVRDHWQVYFCPDCDIHSRYSVRIAREVASGTKENRLRLTIGFINTTTFGAGARGVSWINEDHRNPHALGFVNDVLPQLVERPIRMSRSLLASFYGSLTDTAQFFKGDRSMSVIRNLYENFANSMVGCFLKTGLNAGYFLEFSSGGFGLFLLQIASAMSKLSAVIFDRRAAEPATVRSCGDLDKTQIHPQHPFHVNWLGCLHLADNHQVKLAFDQTQVAFPMLAFEQFKLAFSAGKGHLLSALYCPDAQLHPVQFVGQDAVIKSNRAMRLERTFDFSIQLISICNFRDATNNHLCGQAKHFLDSVIRKFVDWKLFECLTIPRLLADVIAGGVCNLKSFTKGLRLFRRRQEFYLSDQFHGVIIPKFQSIETALAKVHRQRLSLSTAKAGSFLPRSR